MSEGEEPEAEEDMSAEVKWKPIADAPRNGEDIILLLADNSRGSAFWHDGSECYGHRGKAGWFWTEDRTCLLTASNAGSEMYPAIGFMSFDDLPQPKERSQPKP